MVLVGVAVLHDADAERRSDPLAAAIDGQEAHQHEPRNRLDDGRLAHAGELGDRLEGRIEGLLFGIYRFCDILPVKLVRGSSYEPRLGR